MTYNPGMLFELEKYWTAQGGRVFGYTDWLYQ